jgi:hypothetical protein
MKQDLSKTNKKKLTSTWEGKKKKRSIPHELI